MEDNFNQELDDELFGSEGEFLPEPNETEPEVQSTQQDSQKDSTTYLDQMLAERGIDRHNIRFQNENGDIELYDFDDLPEAEKYALLNSRQEQSPIQDSEIDTLNFLRQNNMSLQDFAEYQRQQAIQEYLSQNQEIPTDVDTLSDDEVFVYDLIKRFGDDVTDDEIDAQLEKAKENEEMFAKTVSLLRESYKTKEQEAYNKQQEQAEQERKEQFNKFVDEVVSAANSVDSIQGIEIEDADREQIVDFLLKENANGQTGFYQLLSDPTALFKMAWFALYGEQTFNATLDYFHKEIAKARKGGQNPASKPKVIRKQRTPSEDDPYDLDGVL